MLFYCLASVADDDPTVKQPCGDVLWENVNIKGTILPRCSHDCQKVLYIRPNSYFYFLSLQKYYTEVFKNIFNKKKNHLLVKVWIFDHHYQKITKNECQYMSPKQ